MELRAAIAALESLNEPCEVELHSDSKYLIDAISKKWIEGWKKRGWQTADKKPVKNQDLWLQLLAAIGGHKIDWRWVKGHAGHKENERCDELANIAVAGKHLLEDAGFEAAADRWRKTANHAGRRGAGCSAICRTRLMLHALRVTPWFLEPVLIGGWTLVFFVHRPGATAGGRGKPAGFASRMGIGARPDRRVAGVLEFRADFVDAQRCESGTGAVDWAVEGLGGPGGFVASARKAASS